jgi:hypothetical protein
VYACSDIDMVLGNFWSLEEIMVKEGLVTARKFGDIP